MVLVWRQIHIFVTRFNPRKSARRPQSLSPNSRSRVSAQHRSMSDVDGTTGIVISEEGKKQMDTFDMDQLWNAMQFPTGDPKRFMEYMIPPTGAAAKVFQ